MVAHHNLCRPDLKVIWAHKSQAPVQPGPPLCFSRVHTGGLQSPRALLHLFEGQGYEGFQVTGRHSSLFKNHSQAELQEQASVKHLPCRNRPGGPGSPGSKAMH